MAEAFRVAKLFRGGEQLSPARVRSGENPSELVVYLHHRYNFFNLKEVVRKAADGRWGRAMRRVSVQGFGCYRCHRYFVRTVCAHRCLSLLHD